MARRPLINIITMKRRRRGNYPCNNQCHRRGCGYIAETAYALRKHLSTTRYTCKHCTKDYTSNSSVKVHVRRMHPEHAPPYTRVRHANPSGLPNHQWQFIKTCIHSCLRHDLMKVPHIKRSAAIIHTLATQIAARLKNDPTDDFGGFIAHGMVMRTHGGLFQLSLDRLRNRDVNGYCVHFPDIDNAFANIRLVPLCMNIPYFSQEITIEAVQDAVADRVTVYTLSAYETCCKRCIHHIFSKDPLARRCFGNRHAMLDWTMSRLERIKCRCEISGILLRTHTPKSMWQLSIDAIDPIKGHVDGNMRLVCRFLNCTNTVKNKTTHDPDDGPTAWTSVLFRQYFRITE